MDPNVLTLEEYLNYQRRLEKEAIQLLPGRFDCCTFPEGSIRQRVYVCTTCSLVDQPSGICYSCSMTCHSDHDIMDIYVKRNFRCDCGTGRIAGECRLGEGKKTWMVSRDNKYNHNFSGRYCECDRVYEQKGEGEDEEQEESNSEEMAEILLVEESAAGRQHEPLSRGNEEGVEPSEDKEEETSQLMIQCYLCEDWFHETCVGRVPSKEIQAYLCRMCTREYPFLRYYGRWKGVYRWKGESKLHEETYPDEIMAQMKSIAQDSGGAFCLLDYFKEKMSPEEERELQERDLEVFMIDADWRKGLCTCLQCQRLYERNQVEFLIASEEEKEFQLPEDKKPEEGSIYEAGMNLLGKLDRRVALQGVWAIRDLGDRLKAYLKPFARERRIVTKEDIDRFFYEQSMMNVKAKTNQKLDEEF